MIKASDHTLANGLKIISLADDTLPIICLQLYIKTGSVNENKKTTGYSHFIEHLTFKNTKNFPDNFICNKITACGGVINAYTDFDTTCYYIFLPSEELNSGLEVLAEIAYNAIFLDDDVTIEKDIIIEELKQYENDADSSFIEWVQNSYFKKSSMANNILGTTDSIQNANPKLLTSFYKEYYTPDNALLTVSGKFNHSSMLKNVELYFGTWKGSNIVKSNNKVIDIPEKNGFKYKSRKNSVNGDFIAFVLPELQESHQLSDALLILTKAFASGKQSRLHKRLVENDRSALLIKLTSISGIHPGIVIIQVFPTSNNLTDQIIYTFYDEWLKIKEMLITKEEYELIVTELINDWKFDFEYLETHSSALASEELISDYKNLYNFPHKILKTGIAEIKKCSDIFWNPEYLAIYYQGKMKLPIFVINNVKRLLSTLPAYEHKSQVDYQTSFSNINGFNISNHTSPISSQEIQFKEKTCRNGIKLLMQRIPSKPIVAVAFTIPLSQLHEKENQKGINFLTSSLLLHGTIDNTYDEMQKICLRNGLRVKISHSTETTTLRGKCTSDKIEILFQLLIEILTSPVFPNKNLKLLKNNIVDSIKREKESPFTESFFRWSDLILGKHNNLVKPFGNITQTMQIKNDHVQNWYHDYYNLSNFTVCVSGSFDFLQIEDICNRICFRQESKSLPLFSYGYLSSPDRVLIRKVKSNQANLIMGSFACSALDYESNTALYVLSQIIGGEFASRFFNILREKYGYTYQSGFDVNTLQNIGYWYAYAICDKADTLITYKLTADILNDVRSNGVTSDELNTAVNHLKGIQRFDMESISWQASILSILYALGYDYDYFMNREKRLEAVDKDIIKSIAEKYMNPDNIYTYIEK